MSAANLTTAGYGYDQAYFLTPYNPSVAMKPLYPPPASIAASVGGGSSSVDNTATYTNDPNVEGVVPPNPNANAVAYSVSGAGAIYGWSISQQKWV